jgi:predicted CXXCH cytochrome family protein
LVSFPVAVVGQSGKISDFVTSQACVDCHEQQYAAWSGSHHSWAWREPAQGNVLGDFGGKEFEHHGIRYLFELKNGDYFITADGPNGVSKRYPLHSVAGVTPLQQYLIETETGRLQALDIAWDTEQKRWYHLYPNEDTSAGNGMHWTASYKNWNSRCAECHATDYKKNYDLSKDEYTSTQAETGVGCEACHGPGEAHLSWAANPESFESAKWAGVGLRGLIPTYLEDDPSSEVNLCAPCHSRREPLGANSPMPGDAFDDHYRLALLRDGLYFPDGQIKDEVYVLGSFLQSKMHAKGVKCTSCHDAHSYELKLKGNALCTQCHNEQGNALFPSLKKEIYDTSEHHFHKIGSEGGECKRCHMPKRYYMVIDGRKDHSFRVPRPDLSAKLATPEPCTGCHEDKSAAWAAREIKKHFPSSLRYSKTHFAEYLVLAGLSGNASPIERLISMATAEDVPAIVRASVIDRMVNSEAQVDQRRLNSLTNDSDPWVRMASIGLMRKLPVQMRVNYIAPLLEDSARSVRIEAAKALVSVPLSMVPEGSRAAMGRTTKELQKSLYDKSDFPEIQLVNGGIALTLRNFPAALQAFQRAVSMDPQLIEAWLMIARIEEALGNSEKAIAILSEAVTNNPDNQALKSYFLSLGGGD